VAALRGRIEALQARLAAAGDRQSTFLARLAVRELEQQKDRLATYQVQARFALATMYDRAATSDAARSQAPAPVQKGAEGGGKPPAEGPPVAPPVAAPPATPEPQR
jgi:hypothetical protein